ncbi:DMT family transporter [Herbiconiux sp. L3-i23]|uniref:DMT family transporter n=1 Tax=Herbiconiux sp. L3-i23 TaxID=2905871 RepID=UPI00206BCB27|nr:DMT family transporter [Herbiconiux sp. L3-i23]BDI23599.1 transporter [Herbiconiux sp. L3-i23]
MTTTTPTPTRGVATAAKFVGMGLIWGASFLFMKVALEGTTFVQVFWTRLVLGALALGAVMLVTRSPLPRSPKMWGHFAVVGLVGCVLPYGFFAWAEQYVTSGIASILNATTPIMTALMVTLAFKVERLTREQVLGIGLGVVGVIVIIGPWRFAGTEAAAPLTEFAGQIACVLAALCYGVTFSYLRKFVTPTGVSARTTAFMQIFAGAVIVLVFTPWVVTSPVELDWGIVLSLLVLGVLGTGVAYLWNIDVLMAWGPTAVSTVTYLTPVVGVLLGVLVLGETLSWHEPVGAVLVLIGILFAQRRLTMPAGLLRRRAGG